MNSNIDSLLKEQQTLSEVYTLEELGRRIDNLNKYKDLRNSNYCQGLKIIPEKAKTSTKWIAVITYYGIYVGKSINGNVQLITAIN